jgi:aminopeptidase A. Metallo peptidase. MEROPS family M17
MQYFVKSGNPEKQRVACVVLGIFQRRQPSEPAAAVDAASGGAVGAIMRRGDMDGKAGTTLLLHNVPGVFADRLLLVGLGRERDFDERAYRKAQRTATRALLETGSLDAANYLTRLQIRGHDYYWNIQQAVLATAEVLYRFDDCRGEKARSEITPPRLERLTFDVPRRSDLNAGERGLAHGLAMAQGVELAKNLANLPGNLCTPIYLAERAQELGKSHRLKVDVLDEKRMRELGMGALLAVAAGSRQPPRLICMEYRNGPKDEAPIALVGKGLTFDAGGISIKPSAQMDEMKFDMCGGASVFGAMLAAAELELPINLVGVVVASENLPDGQAVKPGDIITSLAGITIEVLNTDAEGRLILADALAYTEQTYKPALCVDMATLTGACVVALGAHASGLFSNTPGLTRQLLGAGDQVGDRAWELPMWPEYGEQIRSDFADVANIATKGAREAGATIGAVFLQRFVNKMKWAHLDIAGTAWTGNRRPAGRCRCWCSSCSTRRRAATTDRRETAAAASAALPAAGWLAYARPSHPLYVEMTRVDFYILPPAADPLPTVCRLCDKACAAGFSVFVRAIDPALVAGLDDSLWTFRQGSFVSHEIWQGQPLSAPLPKVLIGDRAPPSSHCDVLLNLGSPVPDYFSRFERVLELAHGDETQREAARERFRYYRDRGYPLESHKL